MRYELEKTISKHLRMTPIQNIFKCFNLYCTLKKIKLEKIDGLLWMKFIQRQLSYSVNVFLEKWPTL